MGAKARGSLQGGGAAVESRDTSMGMLANTPQLGSVTWPELTEADRTS